MSSLGYIFSKGIWREVDRIFEWEIY